jgi:hypothetical protein
LIVSQSIFSQVVEGNVENLPVKEYTLTIIRGELIKQGSCKRNDGKWEYTGSCIDFTEGEYAIIYVKMK